MKSPSAVKRYSICAGMLAVLFLFFGVMYYIYYIKPLSVKGSVIIEQQGDVKTVVKIKKNSTLVANYTGETLYAGGCALRSDFVVKVVTDGESVVVNNYKCDKIDNRVRLDEGSNKFSFEYGGLTASETVIVFDSSNSTYAPNYFANDVDYKSIEKFDKYLKEDIMTFSEVYSNWGFIGDSQIVALSMYGLISNANIYAEVGSGIAFLTNEYDDIVKTMSNKKNIVIHIGINDILPYDQSRTEFVKKYQALIKKLKKDLPNSRIIVNCIFPVSSYLGNVETRFTYGNEWNHALLKMCMEEDVNFYTNYSYLLNHQEYFAGDGLHLQESFYKEYWLYDLLNTFGI